MAQTGYTPIQLYYSSTTTNVPLAADLANGELAINITDGKLFYKDNANAVQVIGWKVVPATAGGTGQTSYAVGDLLYANSTTTLAKLADVATGNALISGGVGVAPSWGKIGLTTHVSGVLPVANGGTNASTASITSFNNITGYTASGATGTTSTNLVFSTSPTLTTPSVTGNATLSTGNLVIGTTAKGITTGSSIPLGFGTNNGTAAMTLDTAGKFSVGTTTTAANAEVNINSGLSIAASGLYKPYREFAKSLELTDNTLAAYLTITIPAVANFNDFVNVGGEISYAILSGRETSGRSGATVYGKLYVAISRYYESAATAPVTVTITNTDQALATAGTNVPTITWGTTQTAGTDSAAKNVFINLTVDNPASGSVVQAIAGSFKYHSLNRYVADITVA